MASIPNPKTNPGESLIYQIRIKGHLGREWTDWFLGMTITLEDNGETLLTGRVTDQAALYGVLRTVRDVGLPLVSVMRVQPDPVEASDVNEAHHYRRPKEEHNEDHEQEHRTER